ncbi:unnamed protein product [Cuscuta campestris]|uniref:Uncharacterized protein n=1 Tax=Cuscuta campestris TaxID=132261 RepID=A0A484NTZ8_9ASTE|nr:unnamed protein product [Cuscuta campestris]
MDWLIELLASVVLLLATPCHLIKLCARNCCIVVLTCVELLRNAIGLHVSIFRKLASLALATVTLPLRTLNALQNERLHEMRFQEMEMELEMVRWENKGMEKQLSMAIKEHKMMALMLNELQNEYDKAVVRIEQLEDEVRGLKGENQRLKEIRGKAGWGRTEPSFPTTSSGRKMTRLPEPLGPTTTGHEPAQILLHHQQRIRKAALMRSLFSAALSVVVGTTVWAAGDPCVPLVGALLAVAAMSLGSVVRFLLAVKNNPASEAVALLSFNWFVLGTLSYPALPKGVVIVVPPPPDQLNHRGKKKPISEGRGFRLIQVENAKRRRRVLRDERDDNHGDTASCLNEAVFVSEWMPHQCRIDDHA